MSFTNIERFTSSYLIWMPFISFSWLVAQDFHYYVELEWLEQAPLSCFWEQKKCYNFPPLTMALAVYLSCMAFITLRYVSSIPNLWRISITKGCWIVWNAFSASIEIIIWFFKNLYFILLMWGITFVSGPRWKKRSCLGSHIKYIETHDHKNIS